MSIPVPNANPPVKDVFWSAMQLVAAAVTVAISVLGLLVTWIKEMSAGPRRTRFIDESIKQIQFFDNWRNAILAVRELTYAEKEMLERELTRISTIARAGIIKRRAAADWTSEEFASYKAGVGKVRRTLLIYKQPSTAARIMKRFGVLLGALPLLAITVEQIQLLYRSGPPVSIFSRSSFVVDPTMTFTSTMVFFLFTMMVSRGFACLLERIYVAQLIRRENPIDILGQG